MDTYQINCARKHPICCIKNGMYSGILAYKFFLAVTFTYIYIYMQAVLQTTSYFVLADGHNY